MLPLKEDDVHSAYERVMNRLSGDVSEVLQTVRNNIESELNSALGKDIGECDEEIIQCQKHILEIFKGKREGVISSEQYNQDYEIYSKRIMELQEQQNSLKERNLVAQLSRQRFIEISEILSSKNFAVTDQSIMKRLIERIKVISKHEIEFQFKCGIKAKESL